jgi:Kef-type K+ transport system membrane component KefB
MLLCSALLFFCLPRLAQAASGGVEAAGSAATPAPMLFLFLAILLTAGKIGGIIERYGQPAVIGELFAGILLSVTGYLGFEMIQQIRHSQAMEFFAELGAVILLFQIGLESNITQMRAVGGRALMVALLGVVTPFVTGAFVVGPLLFRDQELVTYLFIGAALVATSVGITAAIYQSFGVIKAKASQIVLGAAVIDDVLGLLVLAVVSAIATGGEVTPAFIGFLTLKAALYLGGAIALGDRLAHSLSRFFTLISTGTGMKLALALVFALVFAYVASLVGLAPIVGAFAAGLVLDQVHFKNFTIPTIAHELKRLKGFDKEEREEIERLIEKQQDAHVEELIHNIGLLIIPIFFVFIGLMVDAQSLLNPAVYITAILLSIAAIIGKLVTGIAVKGSIYQKLFVGTSMIPRGEVGLIFASVGKSLGVIPADVFSTIILTIIISTLIPPLFIGKLAQKIKAEDAAGS